MPAADQPVTLINIFEVAADDVDAFIERWQVRAGIMAAAPGFRDSRLHRAVASGTRFQVVNVAHWDSRADLEAAQSAPAFTASLKELGDDPTVRFTANPAVYEVVAALDPQPTTTDE